MSASRLKVKGNQLSYSEQYTKTFNLFNPMLVQQITAYTERLNASLSEELKLQVENKVYGEAHHV